MNEASSVGRTAQRVGNVWGTKAKPLASPRLTALLFVDLPLRTNERKFCANWGWREHYAGKRKRHADKNKNKAVFGMLTRRPLVPNLDRHLSSEAMTLVIS